MKNGFKVIGISTRTTNKDNKSKEDLGKLWGQFYAENILRRYRIKYQMKYFQFILITKATTPRNILRL